METPVPICDFYAVRNGEGQWLAGVAGYYYDVKWTDDTRYAKVYSRATQARAMQTRVARAEGDESTAEVVRLVVTRCEVVDHVARGRKRAAELGAADREWARRVAQREIREAQRRVRDERARIAALQRQIKLEGETC